MPTPMRMSGGSPAARARSAGIPPPVLAGDAPWAAIRWRSDRDGSGSLPPKITESSRSIRLSMNRSTASRKLLQWAWVWKPRIEAPRSPSMISSRQGQMPKVSAFGQGICQKVTMVAWAAGRGSCAAGARNGSPARERSGPRAWPRSTTASANARSRPRTASPLSRKIGRTKAMWQSGQSPSLAAP